MKDIAILDLDFEINSNLSHFWTVLRINYL